MKMMPSSVVAILYTFIASHAQAAGAPMFTLEQAITPAIVGAVFCLVMLALGRLPPVAFILIIFALGGMVASAALALSWIAAWVGLFIASGALIVTLLGPLTSGTRRSSPGTRFPRYTEDNGMKFPRNCGHPTKHDMQC